MKRVKKLAGWGIYLNNEKEVADYGFSVTVLHPNNMDTAYMCSPADTDMEFDTVEAAVHWIRHYND